MKTIKRKLLSLVLAMAMVLTLAPTALALDPDVSGPNTIASGGQGTFQVTNPPTGATYSWSATGGSVPANSTGASVVFTANANNTTSAVQGSVTCSIAYTPDGASEATTVSKTATFNISPAQPETKPVTNISLNHTTLTLKKGETADLTATLTPSDATDRTITWTSNNSSLVSVANGRVTANEVTTSPVTITATANGAATGQTVQATCSITVTAADTTPSITLTPAANTVQMGQTLSLTVTTSNAPQGATVAWEVTNTHGTGTVSGSSSPYTFTPSKEGSVTITAKLMDGQTTVAQNPATVTVTASSVTTIPVTLTPTQVAVGEFATATATIPSGLVYGTHYDSISWTSSTTAATVTPYTSNNSLASVKANSTGTPTIKIQLKKGQTVVGEGSAALTIKGSSVYISTTSNGNAVSSYDLAGYGSQVTLYARVANPVQGVSYVYSWSVATGGDKVIYAPTSYNTISSLDIQAVATGQTTVYVSVYQGSIASGNLVGSTSITVTVGKNGLQPSATVSGYSDYLLSERDSLNNRSVVDQIESMVNTYTGRYLYSVVFSTVSSTCGNLSATRNGTYYADGVTSSTGGRLSDIVFSPTQIGTATFSFTAYYAINGIVQNNDPLSGVLTIEVKDGVANGDITYSAAIGDDVAFALKDFEDFYYSKTRGSLTYVSFTLPSGGSLYADGGRLSSGNACYASPSRLQTDLAGVYFSPTGTTATRANTVRISFTAYGNRSNTSGTVAITYLAGSAKDITYNINTSGALKASDFTDAYRQVVGSTAPTGLTIEFQSVPTYGSLTYKDSSRTNSSAVTLRSSNIKSYKFTTRTTGTNQLGDVTYTASGTHSDTIEYIAYVNSTPQFTGKVVFNASNTSASNMQVGFTSTNGQAVAFSYAEFAKANATVIASTSYIRFVTLPTGGTLTYNGAALTLSSTNVVPTMLGNVVYRPNTGFNNSTDRVSFLCYDANGNSVGGGQVSIVVTGNTGATSTGASNVSQFKDVSATAWYRDDLSKLMSAGIIQGRGDGKFDPTAELTYGEALKIFMLASGYPAQAEASGKNWAINYKNQAVSNGWISNEIDLSAKISRNAMAELAAKSLGVAASSSVPPTWKDGTSSSYANALYYTNPQILIGNADGTFKGNDTLKRQEICAIAARVLTYRSNQQSADRPSWLG